MLSVAKVTSFRGPREAETKSGPGLWISDHFWSKLFCWWMYFSFCLLFPLSSSSKWLSFFFFFSFFSKWKQHLFVVSAQVFLHRARTICRLSLVCVGIWSILVSSVCPWGRSSYGSKHSPSFFAIVLCVHVHIVSEWYLLFPSFNNIP